MSNPIFLILAAIIYLLIVGSLYIYGINFYYLTYLAINSKKKKFHINKDNGDWPLVTVQLPVYNEMYVAKRLVEASAAINYPKEKLEIQVLDDSTDETYSIISDTVKALQSKKVNISHIHRKNRKGFKAGALKNGLESARGEFIALFDADFIPTKEFLYETIPHFQAQDVAFVQCRWGHINRGYSILTNIQALSIDAHFMIEQLSRSTGGYIFNFNGTAGVWRKSAIRDAGGWNANTLTEDLDLSYRAFLNGWKAVYLRDVVVPAELPVTFTAYRLQQHRWARGSLENAMILLPQVWRSDLALRTKIEASLHLTGYLVHLLLFAMTIIYPVVVFLSIEYSSLVSLFGLALFFNLTALAPTIFFIVAQLQLGRKWQKWLPAILFVPAFGSGMMLNTIRAAWAAIKGRPGIFERTPKHGFLKKGQTWRKLNYQLKLDRIVFFELFMGAFNLFTSITAFRIHHWFISFYTFLFAVGLFFTSIYTIRQSLGGIRKS